MEELSRKDVLCNEAIRNEAVDFSLIPLLPLDGRRIATAMLPRNLAIWFSKLEPYGLIILVGLLVSDILWKILLPIINGTESQIYQLFQFL